MAQRSALVPPAAWALLIREVAWRLGAAASIALGSCSWGCEGGCALGCHRAPPQVLEAGGVRVDLDITPRTRWEPRRGAVPMLTGGGLTAFTSSADVPDLVDGIASLRVADGHARGPIGVVPVLDGTPLRFQGVAARVVDGVATVVRPLRDFDGELTTTLDPSSPAVVYALHARQVETVATIRFRIAVPRVGVEVAFADGAPFAREAAFPPTVSPYVVIGGATPLVIAARSGLEVKPQDGWVVAMTPTVVGPYGTIDAQVVLGVASSVREALALGARLVDRPARRGATIAVEPRNAAVEAPSHVAGRGAQVHANARRQVDHAWSRNTASTSLSVSVRQNHLEQEGKVAENAAWVS